MSDFAKTSAVPLGRLGRMKTPLALLCALVLPVFAADPPKIDSLAFLAGNWRGTNSEGGVADEIYSAPEGGMIVGVGREFDKGRCVFYDLEVFAETKDGIVLTPHPNGKKSPRSFPLVAAESTASKAVFENKEHDFPKRFVWELTPTGELRITLSGERKGQPHTEVFTLRKMGTK